MIDPIQPVGSGLPLTPVAVPRPAAPSSGPSFAEGLRQSLRAADPRMNEIQRFAARSLDTEVSSVRLLQSYDVLSGDEGLYEVQTAKGAFQIIRSRMGELTIYPAR